MNAHKRMPCPKLNVGEKWCDSYLVTYPVSYTYNGGIIVDGKVYSGFTVPAPKVPKGFKLKGIGCGLQLNAKPPYATAYLEPVNGQKVSKKELKALLS